MKHLFFLLLLAWTIPVHAQISFVYDTHSLDNSSIDEQFGSSLLEVGALYEVEVVGTYSIWSSTHWSAPCGLVEKTPLFPSDDVAINSYVAFDFEYVFSFPTLQLCLGASLPHPPTQPRIEISLNNGKTWFHPKTNDAYNDEHKYTYILAGEGYPIGVRHISTQNDDDYGKLKFTLIERKASDNKDIEDSISPPLIVFEMPTVFTPGSDGKNDLLVPKIFVGIENGQLLVYNRWGQLLHRGPLKMGWNGSYEKRQCAPGVYYWLVEYTDIKGTAMKEKGSITLIR